MVLLNSEKICSSLEKLKEEKKFKQVALLNEVACDFKAKNAQDQLTMNHEQLTNALSTHMQIGEE